MRLKVDKQMTGRQLNDATVPEEYIMFELFQNMWREMNKTVAYHKMDPLDKDAVITFSIAWEKEVEK